VLAGLALTAPPWALAACSSSGTAASTDQGNLDSGGSSDGASDGGCQAYVSNANLSMPVSFTSDLMPVFAQNCASQFACHLSPNFAPLQPVLGSLDGGIDAATILTAIVGVSSVEDPQMNIVTAGDPANSYLMHKVDGDQCTLAAQCNAPTATYHSVYPNCGSSMPLGMSPLSVGTRDMIRAWIKQGAK
jgi:hypothetical protein